MTGKITSDHYKPRSFPEGRPVSVTTPQDQLRETDTVMSAGCAKVELTELAAMLTQQTKYAPTESQLRELYQTSPRFSVPIISNALVTASRGDFNGTLIGALVADVFNRALQIICTGRNSKTPQVRAWYKHVQLIMLGVTRSTATPLERNTHENWARAMMAAHFCMGLKAHLVDEAPANASDMLWRLLATSTEATQSSHQSANRRVTWYGMVTRVAISLTPMGKWQEAHAAMRTQANLVKEVTNQIKQMEKADILGVGTLEMARAEMCMGKGKGAPKLGHDDGLEVQVDADFIMAQMLCDEEDTGLGDEFDELEGCGRVVELPVWCTEAAEQVSEPATPPLKKKIDKQPIPRTTSEGKKKKNVSWPLTGVQKTALPGYFRVVRCSGALSEPLDLTVGKKRGILKPSVVAGAVRTLTYVQPTADSLMCKESSATLMADTAGWLPNNSTALVIHFGKFVSPYRPLRKWTTGEKLVPTGLTLNQALALRV